MQAPGQWETSSMSSAFNATMKIVSTLIGLAMICLGCVWILQGLNIAFLDSFMAGQKQWAVYGAVLALVGLGQTIWSLTRR
jgi:hypothetical protein